MKSKLYKICIIMLLSVNLFALTENESLLFKAVEENNIKEIERLIKIPNLNINVLNEDGYALLHTAVLKENDDALKTLLKSKNINIEIAIDSNTEINGWYLGGETALLFASYLNNINALNILLNAGANVLAKDAIDYALAIHIASANGNKEIVSRLLEYAKTKKINLIDVVDIRENTPLHWAAMKGEAEIISILIKNGANIDAIDEDGWTALHYAAALDNIDTVKILINNGASINAVDYNDEAPLYYASDNNVIALLNGKEPIDNEVYSKPTLVKNEIPLTKEQNELMLAVKNGDIISINNLIKNGLEVNFIDSEGYTPLHRAILYGKRTSLEALIKSENINIEAKLPSETEIGGWYLGGATPLLLASYLGEYYMVLLLLDNAEADIFARDTIDGAMAIHIAGANGHIEVINAILSSKATQKAGLTNVVNAGDENNDSPLAWAVLKNKENAIDILLKYGADINSKNLDNMSPIHYAAAYTSPSTIEKLYKSGANLNEKTLSQGYTPIHIAIVNQSLENVKKLVELGGDQNMKDKKAETPYDLADKYGYYDITEYLSNLYTTIPSKKQKEKWWSN